MKYVNSWKGIKTEQEMKILKLKAALFLENEGRYLQQSVEQRALTEKHYNAESWMKYNYLQYRDSLMKVNMAGAGTVNPPTRNIASRAAFLVSGYLEFYHQVKSNQLKPILLQGIIPMDVSQFAYMFGTSRIPGETEDQLKLSDTQHIAVTCRDKWYTVNIFKDSAEKVKVNAKELEECFESILAESSKNHLRINWSDVVESHIARCTALGRSDWFKIREELRQNDVTCSSIDQIESAILHVCLDETDLEVTTEDCKMETELDPSLLSRSLLTGNGQRWFDKSITLHFFKNGYFGASCDHTWGDGLAKLYAYDFAMDREIKQKPYNENGQIADNKRFQIRFDRLKFNSKSLSNDLTAAASIYAKLIAEMDQTTVKARARRYNILPLGIFHLESCLGSNRKVTNKENASLTGWSYSICFTNGLL